MYVRNSKSGRLLRPCINPSGYEILNLKVEGKFKRTFVHKLVAEAFCINQGYIEVNHLDEDKLNNVPSNLKWCSRYQNLRWITVLSMHRLYKDVYKIDADINDLWEWNVRKCLEGTANKLLR